MAVLNWLTAVDTIVSATVIPAIHPFVTELVSEFDVAPNTPSRRIS